MLALTFWVAGTAAASPSSIEGVRIAEATAVSDRAKTAEASRHFNRGMTHYREARYEDAIREFRAADSLRPSATIHYNLAQAHERRGQIEDALREYREYLRLESRASDRDVVERMIANLEHRLPPREAEARIESAPLGAAISVDDVARGPAPQTVRLPPGAHQIGASLEGYVGQSRPVQLTAGKTLTLHFELQALAPQKPLSAQLSSSSDRTAPGVRLPFIQRHAWSVACLSAAGAATVAAVVMGVFAQQQAAALTGSIQPSQAVADSRYHTAKNDALAANILYGVAGVAAGTSVTLFFVEGSF